MRMTPELAKRIVERTRRRSILTEAQQTELLMDWLEGQTYKELMAKYVVSKSSLATLIGKARADAAKLLEGKR